MNLIQLLNEINAISKSVGASQPYICGGTPRDRVLNRFKPGGDIDITTGDNTIHLLSKAVAERIPGQYKQMGDGHSQFYHNSLKIDFSSNFLIPNISTMLAKAGLSKATSMQQEMYSRDFTVNALIMTMDLKKVYDPIGLGLEDINKKLVRTCLPANVTLGYDPKRAVRSIYVAAKLGFNVDKEIINWVKKHPESFTSTNQDYISKKLIKAFNFNKTLTSSLLTKMNLWSIIPTNEALLPYIKERMI